MTPVRELLARLRENIAKLAPLEDNVVPVRFSPRRVIVTKYDGKTLDVELQVYCHVVPDIDYASLEEYWALIRSLLRGKGHPALKAKAVLEFRSAVAMYDRTGEEGQALRERVFQDLKELTDHLIQAAEDPQIELFEGVATGNKEAEEQLTMNTGELVAILFSRPAEIEGIFAHLAAGKFSHAPYRAQLKGLSVRLV